VIQYLKEQHPDRLEHIFQVLRQRVPQIDKVISEPMPNGNLLLQIKDAPFDQPILSKFVSDGTMKMLSYLTVLYDPEPAHFIGIEEPENFLHPRLLPELAEACRDASANSQLLITSHSPFLLNAMKPEEVYVLYRDEHGFTKAVRASEIEGVPEQMAEGGKLGQLWMEGFFGVGDPLTNHGAPQTRNSGRK
jgi:predicted ATPase